MLFHLDNCRKYSDEVFKPKVIQRDCAQGRPLNTDVKQSPLQVLLPFTGFVCIHLNNQGKKKKAPPQPQTSPKKLASRGLDFTDSLEFLRGQGCVLKKADWWNTLSFLQASICLN